MPEGAKSNLARNGMVTQHGYYVHIYYFQLCANRGQINAFIYVYVTVISKTLEHIETFNTNCKVVS